MVALNRAQIPASITTIEALSAWCAAILTQLHFQNEILESPNLVQKVAVSMVFPIQNNGAFQNRFVGRVSLPVLDAYFSGGKIWENVGTLSNQSIPGDFTS